MTWVTVPEAARSTAEDIAQRRRSCHRVAALSLGASAAGGATSTVRVLLTPEEIDRAVKTDAKYRRPGS